MRHHEPSASRSALHAWRNVSMGASVSVVVLAVLGHATGWYSWGWSMGGILVGVGLLTVSHDFVERRAAKLAPPSATTPTDDAIGTV